MFLIHFYNKKLKKRKSSIDSKFCTEDFFIRNFYTMCIISHERKTNNTFVFFNNFVLELLFVLFSCYIT